jgi:V-type H+-transporting ATPase subunit H
MSAFEQGISHLSVGGHGGDLSSMEKHDASKHLFNQVDWESYLRAGVFLSQSEYQLLERAQDNIDFAMGNDTSARALANLLMKLADKCTSSVPAQQYVFTRVEEILEGSEHLAEFRHRALLFTVDGKNLQDGPFLRALRANDYYVQRSASSALALLLNAANGEYNSFITWLSEMLSSGNPSFVEIAVPAMTILVRNAAYRRPLLAKNCISTIGHLLMKLGTNGNAQMIYDLCFCLWALSLDDDCDPKVFINANIIKLLTDLMGAAPSRKVVRMAVSALYNLASGESENVLTEMLSGGLNKILENMIHANAHKQAGDPEVEENVRNLFEILMKNFREFSGFDRWETEVNNGNLQWGITHTEKFWRENAKLLERHDFKMLKRLIALLHADSDDVVAVALYDLGEFTRFYPNGRGVVKTLGGKDIAMELIGSPNFEVE